MKKRMILWGMTILCLLLSGCAQAKDSYLYEPKLEPKEPVEIALAFEEPEDAEWVTLSPEDGTALLSLLDQRFWKSGSAPDGHVYLRNAEEFFYLSIEETDRVFNEEIFLILSLDETKELNGILERYLNIWWEQEPIGTPPLAVEICQYSQSKEEALRMPQEDAADLLELLNGAEWEKDTPELATDTRLWIDGIPYFFTGREDTAYALSYEQRRWTKLEGEAARQANAIVYRNQPVRDY